MTDVAAVADATAAAAVDDSTLEFNNRPFDFISGQWRPRWRGRLHVAMTPITACASIVLAAAASGVAMLATLVYGVSMVTCFGVSASYHTMAKTRRSQLLMQRIDHAMINFFIAGTATPMYVHQGVGTYSLLLLVLTWVGALVGVTLKIRRKAWRFASGMYLATGWTAIAALPGLWSFVGPVATALVAAGGVVYSVGAVIFWRRWHPFSASSWGFHETFHLCTVIGACLHFAAVAMTVLG